MHELGILNQIVQIVNRVMIQNNIQNIKHIKLEVGEASGVIPRYMKKMFPVAIGAYPKLRITKLIIQIVSNDGLVIKEIGY